MERLLELGPSVNMGRYQITPLQVAIASEDPNGVRMLLEAGADPSETGNANGLNWEKGTLMHQFSCLHNASPLHVCRNPPSFLNLRNADVSQRIERMLLLYGAKE